uniref:Uncharacterized protein n=1 Tax=Arundo donax TaxID=35708 RepID=A0A0A8Y7Q4_ARUDO
MAPGCENSLPPLSLVRRPSVLVIDLFISTVQKI